METYIHMQYDHSHTLSNKPLEVIKPDSKMHLSPPPVFRVYKQTCHFLIEQEGNNLNLNAVHSFGHTSVN